jgi:hypothetical protein
MVLVNVIQVDVLNRHCLLKKIKHVQVKYSKSPIPAFLYELTPLSDYFLLTPALLLHLSPHHGSSTCNLPPPSVVKTFPEP